MDILKIPVLENCTVLLNFDDCVYKIKFLFQIKKEKLNGKIYSETLATIQVCLILQEILREMKSSKKIKNIQTEYFMVQTEIQEWLLGPKLQFKLFRNFLDCSNKVLVLKFQIKDFLLNQEKIIDQSVIALDNNAYITPNTHYKANTSYENFTSNHNLVQTDLTPVVNNNKILVHSYQASDSENLKFLMLATPKLGSENNRILNLKKRTTIADIVYKHDVMINRDMVLSSRKREEVLSADKFFRIVGGSERKALKIVSHQLPKEKNDTSFKTDNYKMLDCICKTDTDNTTLDDLQCSKYKSSKTSQKADVTLISTLPKINFKAAMPLNNRQQEILPIFHKNELKKQSLPLGNIKSIIPLENTCTDKMNKNYSRIKCQTGELMPRIMYNELKNSSLHHKQNSYLEIARSKISKFDQNADVMFDKKSLEIQENHKEPTVSDLPQRKRKGTTPKTKFSERAEKCVQNKKQKISSPDFPCLSNIFNSEIDHTESYIQKNKKDNDIKIISSVNQNSGSSEVHLDFLKNGKSAHDVIPDQSVLDFDSKDAVHAQQQQLQYHSCDHKTCRCHKYICTGKFIHYHDIQDSRRVMNSISKSRNVNGSFPQKVLDSFPYKLLKDDVCLLESPEIKLCDLKGNEQ